MSFGLARHRQLKEPTAWTLVLVTGVSVNVPMLCHAALLRLSHLGRPLKESADVGHHLLHHGQVSPVPPAVVTSAEVEAVAVPGIFQVIGLHAGLPHEGQEDRLVQLAQEFAFRRGSATRARGIVAGRNKDSW